MISGVKGVKDILPDEVRRWQRIEAAARRLSLLYGFEEIRIPIFEQTELFARSIGASTDIVEKEMYTFPDRDGKLLTLRPEGTAGVVRAYIEHKLVASPTQKFFYLGPMFRHERPQAGRLRQFHQFGVECFGAASPHADVEVMALLWRFLTELGLPGLTYEVNCLGTPEDRTAYRAQLVAFLEGRQADLCENCRRRLHTNPLRVLDCKSLSCRAATADAPLLPSSLSEESRRHHEAVLAGLRELGIPFVENPRLVRGLDYYTLTAFETTSTHLGAQNAVGAGGRYDGLVEALGGPKVPGVGFAVGLERVALMLPEGAVEARPRLTYVAGFGAAGGPAGIKLLFALRDAGVRADMDYRASTLKAHLRAADRLGAALVLILGDDEVAAGSLLIRDMASKRQESWPLAKPIESLKAHLAEA